MKSRKAHMMTSASSFAVALLWVPLRMLSMLSL